MGTQHFALYFPGRGITYDLPRRRETVLGISETCDLDLRRCFPSDTRLRTISRRHVKIVFIKGEGYALYDLNSLNGTHVNGRKVRQNEPLFLKDGDVVRLAESDDFVIEIVGEDTGRTEPLSQPVASPQPAAATTPRIHRLLYRSMEGEFFVDGERLPHESLTKLEQRLLDYLYDNSGRICPYDELVRNVWGYTEQGLVQDNTVAKQISNLRRKIESIVPGAGAQYIQTIHGRGVKCVPV